MAKEPRISFCMIVKNEEKYIEQCLNSVKDMVDEIVVVDTGSTDKTVELAKKFTDKIYYFEWINDFAAARNFMKSKATSDWIFFLDADEIILKKDHERIREMVRNAPDDVWAYVIIQRHYVNDPTITNFHPLDEDCIDAEGFFGYFENKNIRLFRNLPQIEFRYAIHERVDESIIENGGRIISLGKNIRQHHYGFKRVEKSEDDKAKISKHQMYIDIGLKQIAETPNDPKAYYELGLVYREQGTFDKAEEMLKKAAELNPKYKNPYNELGVLYLKKEKYDQAIKNFEKALQTIPADEMPLINMAVIASRKKNYNAVFGLLKRAYKINPKNIKCYMHTAEAFIKVKKLKQAEQTLRLALRKFPRYIKIYNNLAVVLIKQKKIDDAINVLKRGLNIYQDKTLPILYKLYKNLIGLHIMQKDYSKARELIEHIYKIDKEKAEKDFKEIKEKIRGK